MPPVDAVTAGTNSTAASPPGVTEEKMEPPPTETKDDDEQNRITQKEEYPVPGGADDYDDDDGMPKKKRSTTTMTISPKKQPQLESTYKEEEDEEASDDDEDDDDDDIEVVGKSPSTKKNQARRSSRPIKPLKRLSPSPPASPPRGRARSSRKAASAARGKVQQAFEEQERPILEPEEEEEQAEKEKALFTQKIPKKKKKTANTAPGEVEPASPNRHGRKAKDDALISIGLTYDEDQYKDENEKTQKQPKQQKTPVSKNAAKKLPKRPVMSHDASPPSSPKETIRTTPVFSTKKERHSLDRKRRRSKSANKNKEKTPNTNSNHLEEEKKSEDHPANLLEEPIVRRKHRDIDVPMTEQDQVEQKDDDDMEDATPKRKRATVQKKKGSKKKATPPTQLEMTDEETAEKKQEQKRQIKQQTAAMESEVADNDNVDVEDNNVEEKPLNRKRNKEKENGEPRNARTAFLWFWSEYHSIVQGENPNASAKEIQKLMGKRWRAMPEDEKTPFKEKYEQDKERYAREMEEYNAKLDQENPLPVNDTIQEEQDPPQKRTRRARTTRTRDSLATVGTPESQKEPQAKVEQMDKEDKANLFCVEIGANPDTPADPQPSEPVEEIPPPPYEYLDDPHPVYIEEEAHLYHNPPLPTEIGKDDGVMPKDLRPIPPPPPLPELPSTGKCEWNWDEDQRILMANFSKNTSFPFHMDPVDELFFLEMLERNDVTVISEGLLDRRLLRNDLWNFDQIRNVLNKDYFHKFRKFETVVNADGTERCSEQDHLVSMRVGDYFDYLDKRSEYRNRQHEEEEEPKAEPSDIAPPTPMEIDTPSQTNDEDATKQVAEETPSQTTSGDMTGDADMPVKSESPSSTKPEFRFLDHEGRERVVDLSKTSLYMIDFDVNRLLPLHHHNFQQSFRYPEVLPGGKHCMMHSITPNARPFMGPNMYITPPASFTHFHQDGHGTVDSGHLCLKGYNEIVMLRRLTERHKKHALWIMTGNQAESDKAFQSYFDGLYSEPHGDGLGVKPAWPTNDQIEACKKMGYCPTVCILRPGQMIHINKGRLHAFRKMSTAELPETDCHYKQRKELIKEKGLKDEEICISIAWDWMFRGVSARGINREVCSVLEATILNRKNGKVSLAIPETSLLQMGKMSRTFHDAPLRQNVDMLGMEGTEELPPGFEADPFEVRRGILPGLRHVVDDHIKTMEAASSAKSASRAKGEKVTLAKRPNTHENPLGFPVDPYGNNDFVCKLCSKELSNVYFHCDGCEVLLSKDFNICHECHSEKKFMIKVQMHPLNDKRHTTINHIGDTRFDRQARCPCKNGPVCKDCTFCAGCSCRCHTWFTMHCRFFNKEEEEDLLENVEVAVSKKTFEKDDYLDAPDFTAKRFEMARNSAASVWY